MATENILMRAVKLGGDRQLLHERIRQHSLEAHEAVEQGQENPLIDSLANDSAFGLAREELESLLDPRAYVGRAPEQVEDFLAEVEGKHLPTRIETEALRV